MSDVNGFVRCVVETSHNVSTVGIGPGFDAIAVSVESVGVGAERLDKQEAIREEVTDRRSNAGFLGGMIGQHEDCTDGTNGNFEVRVR